MRNPTVLAPIVCALAGVIATATTALAVPAHPGDVVNLNGTTSAAEPWLAGSAVDSVNEIPFTVVDAGGSPIFQGVFTSEPSASDILGTIRIRYRLRDMQAIGARRVVRVEILGFAGFQTNVDYRTDGVGDLGPNLASRTNGDGAQVSFLFANPFLTPNLDSRYFHVHTNATLFREIGLARIVLNTNESVIVGGVHIPAHSDCPGDVNGDGVINFTDLNTVLSEFGENCP